MARRPRLDAPELLQHVMARGIEKRAIFRDARDRRRFLEILAAALEPGGTQLLAWSLLGNHFHLLLRIHKCPLATIMRRLMTGYATWFNRRHGRTGHLFQNRYKSVVVDEEEYLLELVRYIHLNPIRAGMVDGLLSLNSYPYSGHAVLLGVHAYEGQACSDVLALFGRDELQARHAYRHFMESGVGQGRREELRGGGLIRSAGGRDALLSRRPDERQAGDDRILGAGHFVERVLRDEPFWQAKPVRRSWQEIASEVCSRWGVHQAEMLGKSRRRPLSEARKEFFLRAVREAGETAASLSRLCGMARSSVQEALQRAEGEASLTFPSKPTSVP